MDDSTGNTSELKKTGPMINPASYLCSSLTLAEGEFVTTMEVSYTDQ